MTAVCPGPVDTEFFQVSGAIENAWKKRTMAEAQSVVHRALLDAKAGKQISVYGFWMKAGVGVQTDPAQMDYSVWTVELDRK